MKTFRKKPLRKASSKAQSAMEYLMTYGWAILIISVVLAALFQLGVFNPMTFAPKAPPGSCQVFRPDGPYTTSFINLEGICSGELPQYVAQFNGQSSLISVLPSSLYRGVFCNLTLVAWSYDSGMSGTMGGVVGFWVSGAAQSGWDDIEYNDNSFRFELRNSSIGNNWLASGNFKDKWLFTALVLKNGVAYSGYINDVAYPDGKYIGCIGYFGGGQIGKWDRYFNGSIANVQIYNTSLSASEIQALYQEGIGGAPIDLQHLVAWWPLNGNANDYSGNGNNGQASNVNFVSNWYSGYTPP
ncbi:MAG: LamG-like jellyroll fold domain-containing protein [Candidatus Micrarchaeota archaeon]